MWHLFQVLNRNELKKWALDIQGTRIYWLNKNHEMWPVINDGNPGQGNRKDV
jgi:hypothetical protein